MKRRSPISDLGGSPVLVGAALAAAAAWSAFATPHNPDVCLEAQLICGEICLPLGLGRSCAFVRGDGDHWLAAGAPFADAGAEGGAVRIFRRSPSGKWNASETLGMPQPAPDAQFGISTAGHGTLLAVGATFGAGPATGIGSVELHRLQKGIWVHERTLLAPDGEFGDGIGPAVAAGSGPEGEVVVVGAPGDDDLGSSSGSVYVFRLVGGDWVLEAKLMASDGGFGDNFGYSVAIDGDRLMVGAPKDEPNGPFSGSAYIFERDGGSWIERTKLVPADGLPLEYFGCRVTLAADTAAASANKGVVQGIASKGWVETFRRTDVDGAISWSPVQRINSTLSGFGASLAIGQVGRNARLAVGVSSGRIMVHRLLDGAVLDSFGLIWPFTLGTSVDLEVDGEGILIAGGAPHSDPLKGFVNVYSSVGVDCDADGVLDSCESHFSPGLDCDGDGLLDACALATGAVADANANGTPDPCEVPACPEGADGQLQFNVEGNGYLGFSLGLAGTMLAAGEPRADGAFTDQGRVDVFRSGPTGWTLEAQLQPVAPAAMGHFGSDVAVAEDLVVAAGSGTSAAVAFTCLTRADGGSWSGPVPLLRPSGPSNATRVATDGQRAVTAMPFTAGASAFVAVFQRRGASWTHEADIPLPAPRGGPAATGFGLAMALAGDDLVISAPDEQDEGRVHVLHRSDERGWTLVQTLEPLDGEPAEGYGAGLSLDGDVLAIGGPKHAGGVVNGTGVVDIWERSEGQWTFSHRLARPESVPHADFGWRVALDGEWLVVSADRGSQAQGTGDGSAWLYHRTDGLFRPVGRLVAQVDAGALHGSGTDVLATGAVATVAVGAPGDHLPPSYGVGIVHVYNVQFSDCDGSGGSDACEVANGLTADANGDGVPDSCQVAADLDGSGSVDGADLALLLANWGSSGVGDLDGDGVVDGADLGLLLADWT